MFLKRTLFLRAFVISQCIIFGVYSNPKDWPHHLENFIHHMQHLYAISPKNLHHLLKNAKYNAEVLEQMHSPYELQPWYKYRAHLITTKRIKEGVQFWHQHHKALQAAFKRFGVPPGIIVAIIGVESNYGQNIGHYLALDTLTTLAFYDPARAAFFSSELEHLLLLTADKKIFLSNLKSSYAGALGMLQFMPSSYKRYAKAYRLHSAPDLLHNGDDAILSIAYFLSKHGWHPKGPIAQRLSWASANRLFSNDLLPHTVKEKELMSERSHQRLNSLPNGTHLIFLKKSTQDLEYWLVFKNFKSILCYNPRIVYAMSVYQLSQLLKHSYETKYFIRARANSTSSRSIARSAQ